MDFEHGVLMLGVSVDDDDGDDLGPGVSPSCCGTQS